MLTLDIAMILRKRNELKSFFKQNSRLSEANFAALIDSMLNKRDDQFHGIWKPGQTYRNGDVVVYQGALWELVAEGESCSRQEQPPRKDNPLWKSLIIPVDDDDWEVLAEEGVMWAKVFDRIGIGVGNYQGEYPDRPEARLDVRQSGKGRWLVFPSEAELTQVTLLHTASPTDSSYLITELSLEEVNWLTDAAKGFVFRKSRVLTEEKEFAELKAADSQILMVLKPKRIQGGAELATLGLNVEDPTAMLDITDGSRGQLLFSPDEKRDPALSIVNLDPKCEKNYVAIGVGQSDATLVTDALGGFAFRQGGEYGTYCNEKNVSQGDLLMVVRQHPDFDRPQVGIGTGYPEARLDVKDGNHAQVQILPERSSTETSPASPDAEATIAIFQGVSTEQPRYLTSGWGNHVAGWVSNADRGFVFRQGEPFGIDNNQIRLDQGQTHLVIREDGRVGIGTEDPYTRVEIVNKAASGKFLFNLDQKVNPALGILNLRPGSKENYFTIGADNNHALLVTDSQYGFLFKAGEEFGINDSQIDVNQGRTLVSIRPEGKGRMGIGKLPLGYELDVNGMSRTFTLYQDTNTNNVVSPKALTNVLERVKLLRPITFEWNSATGFQEQTPREQIGFLAHEVDDVFPQVVKTSSDGTQAIAYQNLVPVLARALQELMQQRDETQQRLDTLRNDFTVYRQEMAETLQRLTDRIEQCERRM